ncbi:MAG: hypothetical protein DHS20C02_09450 [Micavibrio sp.]|nr:MAG: hypothetical protein DHS20C02_09450 [Micavibrio sp.]
MITIEQCRAARGLLSWTQQDLADACGMSKTAINNFEKGHSDIKAESLKAIRMAFESADIEFLGHQGLNKRTEEAKILKGTQSHTNLLEDIFETLKGCGGEVMTISTGDESCLHMDEDERMKAYNITERVVLPKDTTHGKTPPELCRCIPDSAFQSIKATFIYGSKVAFAMWDNGMIIVISSRDAAQTEKVRFEHLWDQGTPLSKNSKVQKYT